MPKSSSGAWGAYKTYKTTVSGTECSAKIKIGKTGKYKFKASTAVSAAFAAGLSGHSRALTVKK